MICKHIGTKRRKTKTLDLNNDRYLLVLEFCQDCHAQTSKVHREVRRHANA